MATIGVPLMDKKRLENQSINICTIGVFLVKKEIHFEKKKNIIATSAWISSNWGKRLQDKTK